MKSILPLLTFVLFLFFNLINSNTVGAQSKDDCPFTTKYIDLYMHEDFNHCFPRYEFEVFPPESLDSFEHHGYKVLAVEAYGWRYGLIKDKLYDKKALDIQLWDGLSDVDFSKFTKLEYLKIRGTRKIPNEVFELPNLKALCINASELPELPDSIRNLKNLKLLDISCGSQIKNIDSKIWGLSNLESLHFTLLEYIEPTTLDLSNLKKLKLLSISNCWNIKIDSSILQCQDLYYLQGTNWKEYFTDLPKLQVLSLSVSDTDTILNKIDQLSNLEELYIGDIETPEILPVLAKLPKLKNLGIVFSSSFSEINKYKPAFENLNFLSIHCSSINELPDFIMPNLVYLRLIATENEYNITSAKKLNKYENLRYLFMCMGENYTCLDLSEDPDTKIKCLPW